MPGDREASSKPSASTDPCDINSQHFQPDVYLSKLIKVSVGGLLNDLLVGKVCSSQGLDFSGYSWISGFRYLPDSNDSGVRCILSVISHLSGFKL